MATPLVGVLMGSASDMPHMKSGLALLAALGVPYEVSIMSAHRTPQQVTVYATTAADRGLQVIIAAAGMSAALPGVVAALTHLPVLGVPMPSSGFLGLDSVLSMVQMPAGVPVGTLAVGSAGSRNAALLATRILSLSHDGLIDRLEEYKQGRKQEIEAANAELANDHS